MWPYKRNLGHIVKPILQLWKYTGLPIYKINIKKQTIVASNTKSFFFGLSVLLLVFLFGVRNIFLDDSYVVVDDGLNTLQLSVLFLSNSCSIILIYNKRKAFSQIFSELINCEKQISKLSKKNNFLYANIRNTVLLIAAAKYFLIIIGSVIDCINLEGERLNMIVYYTLFALYYHFEVFFIFYLVTLRCYYQKINKYLSSLKSKVLSNNEINEVFKVHSMLRENFTLIKNSFQRILLAKIFRDVLITSTGIFFVIQTYKVYNTEFLFTTFTNVVWLSTTTLTNFLVPFLFQDIFDQVKTDILHQKYCVFFFRISLREFVWQICCLTSKFILNLLIM